MPGTASEERFLTLLQEHRKILYKVASSYSRHADAREDLVQEMVLQLWRAFDRYDPKQRFSTWMYRVALNVAISAHRAQSRRARVMAPAGEAILGVAAGPATSPEAQHDVRMVQEFIEQLDEMERALVLLYLEGFGHDEIASVLGISASNVGTKIHRIKQRLKERTDATR